MQRLKAQLRHVGQHIRHPFICHKFPNTPTPPLPPAIASIPESFKVYDHPPMPAGAKVPHNPQPPQIPAAYPHLIPPDTLVKICVFCRAGYEKGALITLREMHSNPSCYINPQFHLPCVMNHWFSERGPQFESLLERTTSLVEFRRLTHSADFYNLWSANITCQCSAPIHLKFYRANIGLDECFAEAQRMMDHYWLQRRAIAPASQFIPPYAMPSMR